MQPLRSGLLAAWTRAWFEGRVGADDVVAAVVGEDGLHRVVGLAGETDPVGRAAGAVPLSRVLVDWRLAAVARVRLVLPVPGDVRGLPGPAPFRDAALATGEAVIAGRTALVPEIHDVARSSAPAVVTWQAYPIDPAPDDPIFLQDAEHELTEAIRQTASTLAGIGGSRPPSDLRVLNSARRAGEEIALPHGHPPRAVRLIAQAERLTAVLDIAQHDSAGLAVTAALARERAEALRVLAAAVRRARLAGYNAGISESAADSTSPMPSSLSNELDR